MNKVFLSIFALILFAGCSSIDGKKSEKPNRDFELRLNSLPEKWSKGDSLSVRIELVSKNNEFEPGQPEIFLPLANHAKFDFGKSFMSFSWKPDSLEYIPEIERSIKIKGFFNSKSDSSYIRCTENILINQDASGLYYFQRDEESYQLDTLKL